MKPEQFIREHGVDKAREVVEGAPEGAEFYNNCIYVKNPHSEGDTDYFARWSDGFNAWLDAKDSRNFIDESIDLSYLKRLVESLAIITKVGGIHDAIEEHTKWMHAPELHEYRIGETVERLDQAIRDHESIYGEE